MAIQFPEQFPAPVDPAKDHFNHVFIHMLASTKEGQTPGELWYPRGVAIDPATSYIYVAEGDLNRNFARVSIFSEAGEFLNSYTHEHMKSLYGIAIHGNNLYVTDWVIHAVFQIKIGSDFRPVARIGSRGSDLGQFKSPLQLSISTNGDLYVTDYENDRIQILDSSLHPIREITHPSMHGPRDVKLTTDEIYVLSDEDNPCVHVFSYAGHKIRSLITGGEDMQVTDPYCFCLDAANSLIISDWGTDQIKVFSHDGTNLHKLGQLGHDIGMFDVPTGLALTSNLKLVIVSWNVNYRLQIFSSL